MLVVIAACTPAPPQSAPPKRASVVRVVEPPRYAIPKCPLRYEMKTVETTMMVGMPPGRIPNELLTIATIEARPTGSLLELRAGVSAQPLSGRHRSWVPPDTAYAAVHLETNGARWTERDGPTHLFDGMGTQGGLVWFFPDLPPSGVEGASTEWEIAHPPMLDVWNTELARGTRAGLEEALKQSTTDAKAKETAPARMKVVLERWIAVQGVRVAELSASATEELSEEPTSAAFGGLRVKATLKHHATYRITATGRLLRATVEKDAKIEMVSAGPGATQHHTQHASRQMNLVGACDGPTEPSLVTPLTLEERAIKALHELFAAFVQGERTKVVAAFDPAVRTKHGEARLWDALTTYKALRGDRAFLPAMMVRDEDVSATGATVRLITHGTTPDGAQQNVLTPLDVVITLRETNGQWLVETIRSELVLGGKESLLEISRDRVAVPKGWPPR